MTRQRLDLHDEDIAVLARALRTDREYLQAEFDRRPLSVSDVLRRPEVADAVLGASEAEQLFISPLLFFAVLVHRSADDLGTREWVGDWVGPGSRLPVFDVEPLLEFTDAPGRLVFTVNLLVEFAMPSKTPVPADRLDLDDLVKWLDAVEPADQTVLLRQLGDLALFQAGVFPDSNGVTLSAVQAEHLGRSAQMPDEELEQLVDESSASPGLDALEMLSSAWYRAAAESSETAPVLLRDVANRIRAARRFLNHVADQYLYELQPNWAPGV